MKEIKDLKVVFFGTGPLAESALATLFEGGLKPKYVVTKPAAPSGRGKIILDPNIKHLADGLGIKVLQPKSLTDSAPSELTDTDDEFDLFIVASYGKIIPESILNIPVFGTLNIHPSLLPKYRGPTPIETALLKKEKDFGITIMFLDDKVDHGPILTQRVYRDFIDLPTATAEIYEKLAGVYGASMLLTEVLLPFTRGYLVAEDQYHELATYTNKLNKNSGEVVLTEDIFEILAKYRACTPWPGCYFIHDTGTKKIRVKIAEMDIINDLPVITKVIPEGKKEMSFESFKNGYIK